MSGIRLGDVPDMDSILELGHELLDQSASAGIKLDEQKFKRLVAGMMGLKTSLVLVVVDDDDRPQGFLLGLVEDLFYSRARYATDLAVYVRPGFRNYAPGLMKRFIKWAESKPRVEQIMLGIASGMGDVARVGKVYESFGLSPVGGIYAKRVEQCPV